MHIPLLAMLNMVERYLGPTSVRLREVERVGYENILINRLRNNNSSIRQIFQPGIMQHFVTKKQ